MPILPFGDLHPQIAADVFIADGAYVIGDVTIGITTFGISPVFHFKMRQSPLADAIAAPQRPPMSA